MHLNNLLEVSSVPYAILWVGNFRYSFQKQGTLYPLAIEFYYHLFEFGADPTIAMSQSSKEPQL